MAGVVLETGRIADRIDEKCVAFGDFAILFHGFHEARQREGTFRLIAMDRGEDADADRITAALRAQINVARQTVALAGALELAKGFAEKVRGFFSQVIKRREQALDGSSIAQNRNGRRVLYHGSY